VTFFNDSFLCHQGGKKNSQFSETLVLSLLCKFQANNFGITDDLLQCIGAGVFPASALLNVSDSLLSTLCLFCQKSSLQ
jgi:hypothetical protein